MALGLTNCTFQEGDASDLRGLDDERFDLVVSFFGAMFAPRPLDVAKEMVRVARPGGRKRFTAAGIVAERISFARDTWSPRNTSR